MFNFEINHFLKTHPASNHATYLRGIAALGVMLIHYDGLGITSFFSENSLNDIIATKIVNIGGQGPTVFFISSGYVLYESFQRTHSFFSFMFLRYFRLMPLYLLINTFAALNSNLIPDFFTVILKLFFLDIFSQTAHNFNPVSIGFFVVIEFWLSITLLLTVVIPNFYVKKYHDLYYLALIGMSFACHYAAIQLLPGGGLINGTYLEMFKFQFWFILGSVLSAYKLKVPPKFYYKFVSATLIILSFSSENYLAYFVGLAAAIYLFSESSRSVNYPLIFIGNICFSIYLLHQPLLYFFSTNYNLNPKLIFIIVILFATLTFRFIEVPCIGLSKKLIKLRLCGLRNSSP